MGFFDDVKKAAKKGIAKSNKRIAEERAKEAEEAKHREEEIDKRLDRAVKAYEGRYKAPRTIDDGENY